MRTRRRILALALPVTAVLLLFGGALTPKGLDRPVTSLAGALRELHIAAAHPGQVYFSNMLVIFGSELWVSRSSPSLCWLQIAIGCLPRQLA